MSNSYGVDNAIAKVPTRFKKDIGLQYDRLKWRNRRGRLNPHYKFYMTIQKIRGRINRADLWWIQKYCEKFSV